MGDVGQQQDPRGVRQHFDHLPHQAAGIEHRLPHEHAVLLALVDQDAVGEGLGSRPINSATSTRSSTSAEELSSSRKRTFCSVSVASF